MLELMSRDRPQQLALVAEQPHRLRPREIPTLTWTVDAVTGRPIGRWVVNDEPARLTRI
jgi:hypothetical protein